MKITINKKLRIIIVLAVISGILLSVKLLISEPKAPPVTNPPTIQETATPTLSAPEGQGDPYFYKDIQQEISENYPLFKDIPYKTDNWSIDYLKPLTLEVILKTDSPQTRQEVLSWITAKGVDPATHKIEWKVK